MKGRGFNGEKRSTEDRRFISRTCAIKRNLARYFPAVPTYTPAEDGAASEGQKVRATREGAKIYRAWVPVPGVGLDSYSRSILASSPAWNTEADSMMPILKRRKRKLSKMKLLAQYHLFAKSDAWVQTQVDLTSKPELLLSGTQRGAEEERSLCQH